MLGSRRYFKLREYNSEAECDLDMIEALGSSPSILTRLRDRGPNGYRQLPAKQYHAGSSPVGYSKFMTSEYKDILQKIKSNCTIGENQCWNWNNYVDKDGY